MATTQTMLDVALVESAMRENQAAIEATAITVTVDLPASVPVRGDKVLPCQTVLNLANNAVRHIQPCGTLHISSRHDDSTTALTVENAGEELTDRAFSTLTEPFDLGSGRIAGTVDRGNGLGLASVDSVIHLDHGSHPCAQERAEAWSPRRPFRGAQTRPGRPGMLSAPVRRSRNVAVAAAWGAQLDRPVSQEMLPSRTRPGEAGADVL